MIINLLHTVMLRISAPPPPTPPPPGINFFFLEGQFNRVKYLFAHVHVNDVIGQIRD